MHQKKKQIPEQIREYINYNPETGDLTWIKSPRPSVKVGDVVRGSSGQGYYYLSYERKIYLAQRVAWFLMTGKQADIITHLNHIKTDNRFVNLTEIMASQVKSRGFGNKVSGVSYRWKGGKNPWQAELQAIYTGTGKKRWLGKYATREEAERVIMAARVGLEPTTSTLTVSCSSN